MASAFSQYGLVQPLTTGDLKLIMINENTGLDCESMEADMSIAHSSARLAVVQPDGREVSLGAGGYIVKPRGELHSMWNAGAEPARMIEIISPAGFEKYFIALAEATAAVGRRPDPSVIAPIAERFGLSFDFTEVPELVARHGCARRADFTHLALGDVY